MSATRLARMTRVRELTGLGVTSIYGHINRGLLTPPIKITERCSAWPEHEIDAINKARIRGAGDEEVRSLVKRLTAARCTA